MARGGSIVTVIGDALVDVRVLPAERMRAGGDVPASVDPRPGGQGSNIAVRLARRGVRTRLVSRLADDAFGRLLREALADDGVELVDLGAERTGVVVVILDGDGDRTMLSQRVALHGGGLDPGIAAGSAWLVVSGYLLLEGRAGLSTSGADPRRAIVGCALDPAEADAWAASAESLQPHLVVLNLDEARVLSATDGAPAQLSQALAERFRALVVVTHAAGAVVVVGGAAVHVDQERVSPAHDTTGAGDAFTAVLVAELLDGDWPPSADTLRRAMASATTAAAAVTRVDGAQGRVPGEEGAA